jgi:hypothetical protein
MSNVSIVVVAADVIDVELMFSSAPDVDTAPWILTSDVLVPWASDVLAQYLKYPAVPVATATPSQVFADLDSTPATAVFKKYRSKPLPVVVSIVTSNVPVAVSSAEDGAAPDHMLIFPDANSVFSPAVCRIPWRSPVLRLKAITLSS